VWETVQVPTKVPTPKVGGSSKPPLLKPSDLKNGKLKKTAKGSKSSQKKNETVQLDDAEATVPPAPLKKKRRKTVLSDSEGDEPRESTEVKAKAKAEKKGGTKVARAVSKSFGSGQGSIFTYFQKR